MLSSVEAFLDTNHRIVKQNEFKKIYSAEHAKLAKKDSLSFRPIRQAQDRLREKSFLDPSHSLAMTGLGPSPWRSLREIQTFPLFSSSEKFKDVWLGFFSRMFIQA